MPAVMEKEMVRRNDTAAKIDAEIVQDAKVVAAFRGVSLAEYLSEVLRAQVKRDLETEMAKRQRGSSPPRRPKGSDQ